MGKRGPAPKPTALKRLQGNPGKRPLNTLEPTPITTKPRCPGHLSGEAKREWYRKVKRLHQAGILTAVDDTALALYCDAFGRWVEAKSQVEKLGTVIKTKNNNLVQNPYLAVANRAWDQARVMAKELGLTPSSRSQLRMEAAEKPLSLTDELFTLINT